MIFFFFFFSSRRRHTRLQGDWSSDVCSSDLGWRRFVPAGGGAAFTRPLGAALATFGIAGILIGTLSLGFTGGSSASAPQPAAGAGAAADRNAESLVASGAPEAPGNLQPLPETSAAAASAAAAPAPAASAAASAAAAAPSIP